MKNTFLIILLLSLLAACSKESETTKTPREYLMDGTWKRLSTTDSSGVSIPISDCELTRIVTYTQDSTIWSFDTAVCNINNFVYRFKYELTNNNSNMIMHYMDNTDTVDFYLKIIQLDEEIFKFQVLDSLKNITSYQNIN